MHEMDNFIVFHYRFHYNAKLVFTLRQLLQSAPFQPFFEAPNYKSHFNYSFLTSYWNFCPVPRFCQVLRSLLTFYVEEFSPRPLQTVGPPLIASPLLIIQYSCSYCAYLEVTCPIRYLRARRIMLTGTHTRKTATIKMILLMIMIVMMEITILSYKITISTLRL
jgi:hypothetical protein